MQRSSLRVAVLGKTGIGKSSLCNTLFGEEVFGSSDSASAETRRCQVHNGRVHRRSVTLTDTPGFFDNRQSEEELRDELWRCITINAQGIHAFLIVLRVERFTEHENQVVEKILETFSEEALQHSVVVFTYGEQLDEGRSIEDFVRDHEGLSDLVRRCGGRFHVFDNRYWNRQHEYRSNQFQVGELLTTIERMVQENGGRCYTNQVLQIVQEMIRQRELHIARSNNTMTNDKITHQATTEVTNELRAICCIGTGLILGALLGVPIMVRKVLSAIPQAQEAFKDLGASDRAAVRGRVEVAMQMGATGMTRIPAEQAAMAAGVLVRTAFAAATIGGAAVGGREGHREAQRPGTIMEGMINTAARVWNEAFPNYSNQ